MHVEYNSPFCSFQIRFSQSRYISSPPLSGSFPKTKNKQFYADVGRVAPSWRRIESADKAAFVYTYVVPKANPKN